MDDSQRINPVALAEARKAMTEVRERLARLKEEAKELRDSGAKFKHLNDL